MGAIGATPRVLVGGACGAVGFRLAEGLAADGRCALLVADRDAAQARAAAERLRGLHPHAWIEALAINLAAVSTHELADLGLAALADGRAPAEGEGLRLAGACIGARVAYVGLDGGRSAVRSFAALDGAARAAGVAAVCGAGATPALSNAALDSLTRGWSRVERVEIAVSLGDGGPRVQGALQALLAGAGQPVRVLLGGRWARRPGWGMTERREMEGVGPRLLSLCETADLDVVPSRFPGVRTAVFRAGFELGVLHVGVWLGSLAVRLGLARSTRPFAGMLAALARRFGGTGTDVGGMDVRAWGLDARGEAVEAVWNLVAPGGTGPGVPTLPALALLRSILAGDGPAPGARCAAGLVGLDAIEPGLGRLGMRSGTAHARADRRALTSVPGVPLVPALQPGL